MKRQVVFVIYVRHVSPLSRQHETLTELPRTRKEHLNQLIESDYSVPQCRLCQTCVKTAASVRTNQEMCTHTFLSDLYSWAWISLIHLNPPRTVSFSNVESFTKYYLIFLRLHPHWSIFKKCCWKKFKCNVNVKQDYNENTPKFFVLSQFNLKLLATVSDLHCIWNVFYLNFMFFFLNFNLHHYAASITLSQNTQASKVSSRRGCVPILQ